MKVVLHAGAHITDEGRLNKCLLNNRNILSKHGVAVPDVTSYRGLIKDTLIAAQSTGIGEDTRDLLLEAILAGKDPNRVILSNPRFFGTPKMAANGGVLYGTAEVRLGYYQKMFSGDEIELFMGLCNPAIFLPALLELTNFNSMDDFLRDKSPFDIRWSDLIIRMRDAAPNVAITLWCHEDAPLIWPRIMRQMAGLDASVTLRDEYSMMGEIISEAGMKRFMAYLADKPDLSEAQKQKVGAAFMEKYAIEDAITHEIDIPGWSHEMVDRLTEIYDEDMEVISRIPNVNLILP